MTDKQIIIDGVDVSECKHFKIGTCLADYLLTDMDFSEAKCELCKDCDYKQFKRKEQECEELKQTLSEIEEIAMGIMDDVLEESSAYYDARRILQKISESEE